MKYLAKHNKDLEFKVDRPNKYRPTCEYALLDITKTFFGTVQSLEVLVK